MKKLWMQRSSGFTLLEVMVAMTITALALGSLYRIIAGNKRLAFRAEAALEHAVEVRSLINFAQLNDEQGEVTLNFQNDKLQLVIGEKFKEPERKTQASSADLRGYLIKDENNEEVAQGSYWVREPLPAGEAMSAGTAQSGGANTPGATAVPYGGARGIGNRTGRGQGGIRQQGPGRPPGSARPPVPGGFQGQGGRQRQFVPGQFPPNQRPPTQ